MLPTIINIQGRLARQLVLLLFIGFYLSGCAEIEEATQESNGRAPKITLSADLTTIGMNDDVLLGWSGQNVSNCFASGDWSGDKAVEGYQLIRNLTEDSSFTITCSGEKRNVSKTVYVTVAGDPVQPTLIILANPASLPSGGSTTLTWIGTNASSCSASGGWTGTVDVSGSMTMNGLTSDTTFSLSCTGSGGTATESVSVSVAGSAPPPAGPPVVNLSASPSSIAYNGTYDLIWSTSGADSCSASGDWSGNKPVSGSRTQRNQTMNGTYTLTCTGAGGSGSDTVTVTVGAAPPTLSFSANPAMVAQNGSTTLSWDSTDTSDCTASGDWSGNRALSGSLIVSGLTTASQFNLICNGPGGTVSDTVSVTIGVSQPTLSFTANPTTVAQNGSTTLTWDSSDATDCTASGDWSGNRAVTGSQLVSSLTADSQFSLTCEGPGGAVSNTVSVTVNAPAPTLSFSANPATVAQNGSTTLIWDSADTTGCTASGAWSGNRAVSGSQLVSGLTIDSRFDLACIGPGGSVNDSANVTVVLNNSGTALLSWTPPSKNEDDTDLTDLAGYRIYYGVVSGNYSDSVVIDNPGLTSYLIENLASATWYFSMTAVNSSGMESEKSFEVSKTIN